MLSNNGLIFLRLKRRDHRTVFILNVFLFVDTNARRVQNTMQISRMPLQHIWSMHVCETVRAR